MSFQRHLFAQDRPRPHYSGSFYLWRSTCLPLLSSYVIQSAYLFITSSPWPYLRHTVAWPSLMPHLRGQILTERVVREGRWQLAWARVPGCQHEMRLARASVNTKAIENMCVQKTCPIMCASRGPENMCVKKACPGMCVRLPAQNKTCLGKRESRGHQGHASRGPAWCTHAFRGPSLWWAFQRCQ